MTDSIDFHPLPGDGPTWDLSGLLGQIDTLLAELPAGFEELNERQHEEAARLTAARAVLSGHAVLFGWDISYRDDTGFAVSVSPDDEVTQVGDLRKGDRPKGHIVGNVVVSRAVS